MGRPGGPPHQSPLCCTRRARHPALPFQGRRGRPALCAEPLRVCLLHRRQRYRRPRAIPRRDPAPHAARWRQWWQPGAPNPAAAKPCPPAVTLPVVGAWRGGEAGDKGRAARVGVWRVGPWHRGRKRRRAARWPAGRREQRRPDRLERRRRPWRRDRPKGAGGYWRCVAPPQAGLKSRSSNRSVRTVCKTGVSGFLLSASGQPPEAATASPALRPPHGR